MSKKISKSEVVLEDLMRQHMYEQQRKEEIYQFIHGKGTIGYTKKEVLVPEEGSFKLFALGFSALLYGLLLLSVLAPLDPTNMRIGLAGALTMVLVCASAIALTIGIGKFLNFERVKVVREV